MRNSNWTKRSPNLSLIAWILIGLMVGGSLVDYLTATEPTGICSELRLLELEDDKGDDRDVAYIPATGHALICSDALPGDEPVSHSHDVWFASQANHFERGPPSTRV